MYINYGWICPMCGRGNAPWKGTCDCGPQSITWPASTGDPIPPPSYTTCKSKDKEEVK